MENFLSVKKSTQIKFLMKAAKEFSNSLMAQVLVLVKARMILREIQNTLQEKDGHNSQGIYTEMPNECVRVIQLRSI